MSTGPSPSPGSSSSPSSCSRCQTCCCQYGRSMSGTPWPWPCPWPCASGWAAGSGSWACSAGSGLYVTIPGTFTASQCQFIDWSLSQPSASGAKVTDLGTLCLEDEVLEVVLNVDTDNRVKIPFGAISRASPLAVSLACHSVLKVGS